MADNIISNSSHFKEAVCIDAGRIYDSCCDRDCLEDLRCYFSSQDQMLIEQAKSIRVRSAQVVKTNIDVEPVTFNKGYYSCDITFFFVVEFDVFSTICNGAKTIKGITYYNKKVILYGGEGNVKVFSNSSCLDNEADNQVAVTTNAPKCVVQCVDPIALSAKICEVKNCYNTCNIPSCVCNLCGGDIVTVCNEGTPTVFVTLGLFSIVQLIRNVQMSIPVYDFCIPQKQCDNTTDEPCDVFSKIKFPEADFFPASEQKDKNKFNCCK